MPKCLWFIIFIMTTNFNHWFWKCVKGWAIVFFVSSCAGDREEPVLTFPKPPHFPSPTYNLALNPVSKAGFELGRALFYEPMFSRDNSVSCGSCHQQSAAFTHHGHAFSHGIDDKIGTRNAPPIMNLAWSRFFMWDGGIFDLDLLPIAPVTNPVEMDESMDNVLSKLRKSSKYKAMFQKAFGDDSISLVRTMKAMSQFMLLCVSAESPYDFWKQGKGSLSTDELQGMQLVQTKCNPCHESELFTDGSFRNNGIGIGRGSIDLGRYKITLQETDKFRFKVPSLRNLEYTAPYMHDGRFLTLEAVLNHYSSGIKESPTLDPILFQDGSLGIALSSEEKKQILAFLHTLNDPKFLKNESLSEFSNP